jgi:transposase
MRNAGARKSAKIRHIVRDLHEKLAKFLWANFSVIVLAKFATSTMFRRVELKFRNQNRESLGNVVSL